ncbi:TRAP transporter large permease [Hoeflea sp. CAU 1731]|nr:TRAP transporter large permease [Paracoccaceae bacterium]
MEGELVGILGFVAMLSLVALGVPIAFSAGIVGLAGLLYLRPVGAVLSIVGGVPYHTAATYSLTVVPLFIAIGFLSFHAGITTGAFKAAKLWLGRIPGGLATATIFASAGFAAVSGSSTASTAVFTRLAVPEMEKSGYNRALAAGVCAVGGTLAALIPPSAILVIYGILVEESIGALLLAGIIPGLISLLVYAVVIAVVSFLRPEWTPQQPRVSWGEKFKSLSGVWGIFVVVGVIFAGTYFGWATPTESAALAVVVVLIMAIVAGMTWPQFREGLVDTVKTTAMIFTIIWAVHIFVRFLAFTGLTNTITNTIVELDMSPQHLMVAIVILYLLLGMVLDGLGILILTLPIIYPVVTALGFNSIWFGVLVVKLIEIGLVTPPIGLNCYIVNSVRPDIKLGEVFRGVAPFLVGEIVIVTIILFFPELVLFLPNRMN